jgi:hypothetical protein
MFGREGMFTVVRYKQNKLLKVALLRMLVQSLYMTTLFCEKKFAKSKGAINGYNLAEPLK